MDDRRCRWWQQLQQLGFYRYRLCGIHHCCFLQVKNLTKCNIQRTSLITVGCITLHKIQISDFSSLFILILKTRLCWIQQSYHDYPLFVPRFCRYYFGWQQLRIHKRKLGMAPRMCRWKAVHLWTEWCGLSLSARKTSFSLELIFVLCHKCWRDPL